LTDKVPNGILKNSGAILAEAGVLTVTGAELEKLLSPENDTHYTWAEYIEALMMVSIMKGAGKFRNKPNFVLEKEGIGISTGRPHTVAPIPKQIEYKPIKKSDIDAMGGVNKVASNSKPIDLKSIGEKNIKELTTRRDALNKEISKGGKTPAEIKAMNQEINALESIIRSKDNVINSAKESAKVFENIGKVDIKKTNTESSNTTKQRLNPQERGLLTGTNKVKGLQKTGDSIVLKDGLTIVKTDKVGGYKLLNSEGKLLKETTGNNKASSISTIEKSVIEYRDYSIKV
ncbi:MAG: hypothetical protein Q9M97_00040, partial [Candidatus Gracilibacteria bacterium]|nr:hypothetical protein [Candidatus Gracilibacteria bacterium]